jgi:hypothetical protein
LAILLGWLFVTKVVILKFYGLPVVSDCFLHKTMQLIERIT